MNIPFVEMGLLAQQAAEAADGGAPSTGKVLLIVFVTIILPVILGQLIARWLKVPKFATRLSIVMLALFLSLAPFAYHVVNGRSWTEAIRLGIDLAGGTNLVFQVDVEAARKEGKDVAASIDRMIGAISRRINPSGTEEVVVRKVGRDRIEVIIPGADPQVVEEKKRLMTNLGSLEFAVLANRRDHGAIIEAATKLPDNVDEYRQGKRVVAIWRKIADDAELGGGDIAIREVERKGERIRQVLVIVPPEEERVTGRFLVRAEPTIDEMGRPAVAFTFNQTGAYRFTRLTSRYRPRPDGSKRQLAIILNNEVESAPSINDVIGRNGIITGNFTQQEIRELTNVLNAGALEIPIKPKPVSEFTISPLLGHDIQEKGKRAIVVGAIAVVVFMAFYYRTCGWIANACLLVNLILIMGTMALIQAAFTLPGLAGLVLTIGMAVDANVLIFERMREEVQRGASVRMAIHNGFGRAFTTIVDANLTTLITAVVLYVIGTDQVKGFAVLLFVGIVMSMFSALYVGRLIFDILEQRRWLREIRMRSIVGETNWDFFGKRRLAYTISALIIGCGMVGLVARGADNLDIDFRGGTMVTFEFVQPQETAKVKRILEERLGVGITLEPLRLSEEDTGTSDVSKRFRLRSTLDDLDKLRHEVAQALSEAGLELRRVTVELGEIRPIPAAEQAQPSGAAPSAPPWTTGSAPAQPAEGPELVSPKKPSSTSSPAARPNPPAQPKPDKAPDTQEVPSGN
ncbi:MAG: protein translocase subunit SecD, partial [Planctomycetota bacterium]